MARLARTAIHFANPKKHVDYLLQLDLNIKWQREAKILAGVGELELQNQKGLIKLDKATRINVWEAAKSGSAGVQFHDVFDKHVAGLLESTTPGGPEVTLE